MFMDKNDWSDDELEDVNDETLVVPMSMVPTPQVLSNGTACTNAETSESSSHFRASAYNERMARARNSMQNQRRSNSGESRAKYLPPPMKTSPLTHTCYSLCTHHASCLSSCCSFRGGVMCLRAAAFPSTIDPLACLCTYPTPLPRTKPRLKHLRAFPGALFGKPS